MNLIYSFYIDDREVFPNYSTDVSLDIELENNQRFYRKKLSGKFTFLRDDYDFLNMQPFDTEFIFIIKKSTDNGKYFTEYYRSKFMKTDCAWNADDKTAIVQPDPIDEYNDVLAGLEKEYNLIELAPEIERVTIQKRPLMQVYQLGDSVLSCFLAGSYWEQECDEITNRDVLVNKYGFTQAKYLREINITVNGTPKEASGLYIGLMTYYGQSGQSIDGVLSHSTNDRFKIYTTSIWSGGRYNNVIYIRDYQNHEQGHTFENIFTYGNYTQTLAEFENIDFLMESFSDYSSGTANGEMATYLIYTRMLTDAEIILGQNTIPVSPDGDIAETNLHYRRVLKKAFDTIEISNVVKTEPAQWGRRDDRMYYNPPASSFDYTYYPITRSSWRYSSVWFRFDNDNKDLERAGRSPFTLRDAFPLSSVIQILLREFAPSITHLPTPEYSQFLYGANNPISQQKFTLLITPKSNILHGDYDRPAQKAPTTLQQITNMLRDVFRCYWYIENGKFKIEHISFFKNGGSYSETPQIGTDLTAIANIRNRKTWGYLTSAWDFDKVDMAERFQFDWMDDVTQGFKGFPIEVLSKYVQQGKIENINVGNFTSDIDYMILNPTAISNDGFALMAATNRDILRDGGSSLNIRSGFITPPDGVVRTSFVRNEFGYGWHYMIINCNPGQTYILNNINTGEQIYGIVWHFYDANRNYLGIELIGNAKITVPNNCYYLGMNWAFETSGSNPEATISLNPTLFSVHEQSYSLPFIERSIGNQVVEMQNGLLSYIVLHPTFWIDDLPARSVKINDDYIYVRGIERKKKQTAQFPVGETDPDPIKLIKTYIGNGEVSKLSINLHSRGCEATLKYDTE